MKSKRLVSPSHSTRTLIILLILTALALPMLTILAQIGARQLVIASGGRGLSGIDRVNAINDARTFVTQLLGGIVLIGGLAYTARTFALSRSTQIAERFFAAMKQLSDNLVSVRVAAVYSLRAIANEYPDYWPQVDHALSALVHEKAVRRQLVWTDVLAALTVLGGRLDQRPGRVAGIYGERLDLRGVYLSGLDLSGLILDRARLDEAFLENSKLTDTSLDGATFIGAHAANANFSGAVLTGADLSKADFRSANFRQAQFNDAEISGADFMNAVNLAKSQVMEASGVPKRYPTPDFLRD